jgi:hypothetical protein
MQSARTFFLTFLVVAGIAQGQTLKHATVVSATKTTGADAKANAHYYGSVDLGSKGTKGELFYFVAEEEGRTPVGVFGKTVNTSLVSSMKDGQFTKAGIDEAVAAVQEVVEAMKAEADKRKVHVDAYFVVGSSGVAKATNKSDLAQAVKASTAIEVAWVDAAHEGYFGTVSSVPLSRRPTSIFIDIGSGNAKLGCLIGPTDFKNFKSAEIPYGSVSGRNEAIKRNPKDLDAGLDSLMTDISQTYEAQSRDIPCLRNRDRVYWTGGAAWATASFAHPESALNGYVTITKHDLDTFVAALKDGTWMQKKHVFVFPKDMPIERQTAIRAKAASDWNGDHGVLNVFVKEDLISGVSIMETFLNSSNPSATIRFVRNGNFLYGYALNELKGDAAQ